jgi:hypothetical protein
MMQMIAQEESNEFVFTFEMVLIKMVSPGTMLIVYFVIFSVLLP